jgi:hypothetical protein
MRRPRLLLSQIVIGLAVALAVAAFGPRPAADAVAPDREDWVLRCERAHKEVAAHRGGVVDSHHALPAINQRTLSKCAERGIAGTGADR